MDDSFEKELEDAINAAFPAKEFKKRKATGQSAKATGQSAKAEEKTKANRRKPKEIAATNEDSLCKMLERIAEQNDEIITLLKEIRDK